LKGKKGGENYGKRRNPHPAWKSRKRTRREIWKAKNTASLWIKSSKKGKMIPNAKNIEGLGWGINVKGAWWKQSGQE